jgi:hypothetical protein
MNMNDPLREDLQNLMGRFAKAGWTERSMISSGPCKIDFTPLGLRRMDEMVEYLQDFIASGMEPTAMSVGQLGEVVHELLPPNFSKSEFAALLGIIEAFRNRAVEPFC